MDLNKAVIMITERCDCRDNPPPANSDGYAVHARVRCLDCFDTGVKRTQMSLVDLKNLLALINTGNSG